MSFLIVSISEITPWFSSGIINDSSSLIESFDLESVLSIDLSDLFGDVEESDPIEEDAPALLRIAEKTKADEEIAKIIITNDEMLWPVGHKSEVVSGFPYSSNGGAHHGIDIFVSGLDGRNYDENGNSLSYGKPFRAAQSGVVIDASNENKWNTGFGNYCLIEHSDGTQTLYAHAKTVYVSVGDTVNIGQTLGEIGDSGNTTSPHLHFEVRVAADRVNPMNYVSEPVA